MSEAASDAEKTTRERILDIALDLFTEKGYDKTSLREIADRVGFTKAALYYHFSSKGDLLMALHLRLHQLTEGMFRQLGEGPVTPGEWATFLDQAIDRLQANHRLFVMHLRNASAFEEVHNKGHEGQHVELEDRMHKILADSSLSLGDRLRMAAAFTAAFMTPMFATELLAEADDQELISALRGVVRDILRKRPRPRRA